MMFILVSISSLPMLLISFRSRPGQGFRNTKEYMYIIGVEEIFFREKFVWKSLRPFFRGNFIKIWVQGPIKIFWLNKISYGTTFSEAKFHVDFEYRVIFSKKWTTRVQWSKKIVFWHYLKSYRRNTKNSCQYGKMGEKSSVCKKPHLDCFSGSWDIERNVCDFEQISPPKWWRQMLGKWLICLILKRDGVSGSIQP